ncbi:hypothetical protein QYM41_16425 [Kocuria sp. CPCC 205268]|uniref:hypothetical protein n=1 Tax=Kocuria oxytropis TaxID=3058913 RepID=UPI0034D3C665
MADLKNIALTLEAGQAANNLKEKLGIDDQMALIRLGFAYAIKHGQPLHRDTTVGTRGGSNYDTGGLDPDGRMADTVQIYYSADPSVEAEPYRAIEVLMNKGLRLLAEHVQQGEIGTVGDLVSSPDSQQ